MKSKSFNTTKRAAYDACKEALEEFECELISSNFQSGEIVAKKPGGLLSYGHNIYLHIKKNITGKIKITVFSTSIGVQLVDWGTNSVNEKEFLEIISDSIL